MKQIKRGYNPWRIGKVQWEVWSLATLSISTGSSQQEMTLEDSAELQIVEN